MRRSGGRAVGRSVLAISALVIALVGKTSVVAVAQVKPTAPPIETPRLPVRFEEFVRRRLESKQILGDWEVQQRAGWPFTLLRVRHAGPGGQWPSGTLIAAFDNDSALRWIGDFLGDFPPHAVYWLDVNGDRRLDLFMLGGEEDVSNSWVFVDPGQRLDFVQALYDSLSYLGVIDLDGDRVPEFVGTAFSIEPGFGDDDPCADIVRPAVPMALQELARRARREYGVLNFDYGMGPSFSEGTALKNGEAVRIWSIRDTIAQDVTTRFHDQLILRRQYLEVRRIEAQGACRAVLDRVATYLDSVIVAR